jgi:hypothetical protein
VAVQKGVLKDTDGNPPGNRSRRPIDIDLFHDLFHRRLSGYVLVLPSPGCARDLRSIKCSRGSGGRFRSIHTYFHKHEELGTSPKNPWTLGKSGYCSKRCSACGNSGYQERQPDFGMFLVP